MVKVFYDGFGEWFIKGNDGETSPHSSLISYVWYSNYDKKYHPVGEGIRRDKIMGYFMLTNEDAIKCRKRMQRYHAPKSGIERLDFDFIKVLLPLPSESECSDMIVPPGPDLDGGRKYFFKIKKEERESYYPHIHVELNNQGLTYQEAELEEKSSQDQVLNNNLDPRSETSYLHIIGALLEYINGDNPRVKKHSEYVNESQLIKTIAENYGDYYGISVRSLSIKLPKARKKLKEFI